MPSTSQILFPPFRLDLVKEQVWRGSELVPLRPKPFAVLRYLVEQAGRVVTRAELVKAVWPQTYVSEGVLRVYIRDLRAALGDEATVPQFIATVGRQGYRFIASITTSGLVGREAELRQLHGWLTKALDGTRQLVFVTGEPGIGKTTVVDAFLQQATSKERLWIARGQCIEHYSASEAYLPVLEALERLCRGPDGARVIAILRQYAPLWLAQLPSALDAAEREALQRQLIGATQERMLREMARALEELTAEHPLVLWLEDLHGSDYATLDLLAFLARRRELARLLVIGTCRPRNGEHPLSTIQQELQVRGQCQELALEPLSEGAVAEYLESQFGAEVVCASPLQMLAHVIHQRTEGNPLFMVSLIETVLRHEELGSGIEAVGRSVPANIRHFIEQQVEQMKPEEREVLEVASVAGRECSAAAIAAGLEERVEEVEKRCASLTRRGHFIQASGIEEWPDGTVATNYCFVHALYQEMLYEGVTAARRVSFHRRLATRIEHGYGERAGEVAAELAMHYERGRDYERAVRYLHLAGETALQRYAPREAMTFLTQGIALLETLPKTSEHCRQELALYMALGVALSMSRGYADPEVARVYTRARELCQQVGDISQLFPVLQGLWTFSTVQADYQTAQELGEQLLQLAQSAADPVLLPEAHQALGIALCFLGDLGTAQKHLEQSIALYSSQPHRASTFLSAQHHRVGCFVIVAWILWLRGYPDQALARGNEALTLARQPSHPFSLGVALFFCAAVSQHCHRQGQAARQWAGEAIALSTAQGFPLLLAMDMVLQGALLVRQGQSEGGIEQMQQGLATCRATGEESLRTYFLALLAEAYGAVGQPEEGLAILAEALATVDSTGERFYEAELWRLKGQLALQGKVQNGKGKIPSPQAEAEECFHQAITIARQQSAKSWELRATMSLSRLWQYQGKKKQAQQRLEEIYGWFTEGFDTADLQEACRLLEELS